MDRFVVMVDAGYLLRQSIEIVSHKSSTKRQHLDITDPSGLMKLILDRTRAALDLGSRELLRVYWYDGVMANGLTQQQRSIVDLADVNFRAGTVNSAGQQKGVDSLIVTDLLELASHHAISDAALVTGDGDLAIGIDIAQKRGVRIAVIGVEDLSVGVSHKQSFEITSRADRVARIGSTEINHVMRYVPPVVVASVPGTPAQTTSQATCSTPPSNTSLPATAPASTATPATASNVTAPVSVDKAAIEKAVQTFVTQQASLAGAVDVSTKRIDGAVDRALIHYVFTELAHGQLSNSEKIYARDRLRRELGVV